MTDFDQFEQRLAAALRSDADASVGPFEAGSVADAAIADTQAGARRLPRATTRSARRYGRGRGMTLLAAAAVLLVGGAVAGSGILQQPMVVPPTHGPSFGLVATASPDTTSRRPSSEATSSPQPSPTPTPMMWTQASLQEDWPAPVRTEPAGGASVQPVPLTYLDPIGDTGSDTDPWVDIRGLMADTNGVDLKLVSNQPPVVDPAERWIAYGAVIDDDRDGVPDWRYGIDNTPASDGPPYRVWRTNLHTSQTDAGPVIDTNPRLPVNLSRGDFQADRAFQASYPSSYRSGQDAGLGFGGVIQVATSTGENNEQAWGIELDMPFYTWASVIVNGRVVATDFAPDAGWLVATRGAKPGGTFLLADPFPIHLSMTVRGGWRAGGDWLSEDSWKAGIAFVNVDNDAGETCGQGTIERLLDPGVDDLVTYLAGLPSIDISESEEVTLDGYRGMYLEFNQKGDTEQGCSLLTNSRRDQSATAYPLWDGEGYHQVWILDVDGVRLVIDAFSPFASSESVRAGLRQVVESTHFEP